MDVPGWRLCCGSLYSWFISPLTTRHSVFLSCFLSFTFVTMFHCVWCSPWGSSRKQLTVNSLSFPPSLWSPSIPGGKTYFWHYSNLLAVAIFMDLSVECNRKAVVVNSNRRPTGVRLDWISISQVHCFLLPPLFPRSIVLCSLWALLAYPCHLPSSACMPARSSNQLILAHFHTIKTSRVSHLACFRRSHCREQQLVWLDN